MHLIIHKAKDCKRLVFTEKQAGRGKSERADRHDRLMSDDDRPISFLDRLQGTEIDEECDSNLLAVTGQPHRAWGQRGVLPDPRMDNMSGFQCRFQGCRGGCVGDFGVERGPVALRRHVTPSHDLAADLVSTPLSGFAERWVFLINRGVRPQTACQVHTSRAEA